MPPNSGPLGLGGRTYQRDRFAIAVVLLLATLGCTSGAAARGHRSARAQITKAVWSPAPGTSVSDAGIRVTFDYQIDVLDPHRSYVAAIMFERRVAREWVTVPECMQRLREREGHVTLACPRTSVEPLVGLPSFLRYLVRLSRPVRAWIYLTETSTTLVRAGPVEFRLPIL